MHNVQVCECVCVVFALAKHAAKGFWWTLCCPLCHTKSVNRRINIVNITSSYGCIAAKCLVFRCRLTCIRMRTVCFGYSHVAGSSIPNVWPTNSPTIIDATAALQPICLPMVRWTVAYCLSLCVLIIIDVQTMTAWMYAQSKRYTVGRLRPHTIWLCRWSSTTWKRSASICCRIEQITNRSTDQTVWTRCTCTLEQISIFMLRVSNRCVRESVHEPRQYGSTYVSNAMRAYI